jgi:hypothetical protein
MCGHLLSEKGLGNGLNKAGIDLAASDDLKAAAEAALRELGRGPQKAADRPSAPDNSIVPQEKSAPAKPKSPAKKPAPVRPRGSREKSILIGLALVTLIALLSILFGAFRPRGGTPPSSNTETAGATTPSPIPQGGVIQGTDGIEVAPPEETVETPEEPSPPSQELNLEELRAGISSVISRINSELGSNLTSSNLTLNSSVIEQDNANLLAQVSFQGSGYSGSVTALFRRFDFGWRQGWQLTHFRDCVINFSNPVTITSTAEEGSIRRSVSAAQVGGNALEAVASLAGDTIQYQYR